MKRLVELPSLKGCSGGQEPSCAEKIRRAAVADCGDMGYTSLVYTQRPRSSWNKPEDASFMIYVKPDGWMEQYGANNYFSIDPAARFTNLADTQFMPIGTWDDMREAAQRQPAGDSEVDKQRYLKRLSDFFEHASKYGMKSGAFVIEQNKDQISMISVTSPVTRTFSDQDLRELRAITILLTQVVNEVNGCAACGRDSEVGNKLSAGEIALMRLVLDNKYATQQDLTRISGKSIGTIEEMLKRIRGKLNKQGVDYRTLARDCYDLNLLQIDYLKKDVADFPDIQKIKRPV